MDRDSAQSFIQHETAELRAAFPRIVACHAVVESPDDERLAQGVYARSTA